MIDREGELTQQLFFVTVAEEVITVLSGSEVVLLQPKI